MKAPQNGIVIAGGGTGGHLFPGIAVAVALRARYPGLPIHFVGTARGLEVRAVPRENFPLHLLDVLPLRGGGVAGALRGMAAVPMSVWQARKLLQRLRPKIALGVGGYAAGPALLAAFGLSIPTLILEQNAKAGLTNRWLGRVVGRVLTSQPSRDFPPAKVTLVGNPIRPQLLALTAEPYAPHLPPRLLVMGGSQGARALNRAVTAIVPELLTNQILGQVVHQTGKLDEDPVREAYRACPRAQAHAFVDDMAHAYRHADLIVCRAGASTLAEIAVCGRPSLLIPYPSAADDHQTANARVFASAGASILLKEKDMTPDRLKSVITDLVQEPNRLAIMAKNASLEARPNALADIVAIVAEGLGLV